MSNPYDELAAHFDLCEQCRAGVRAKRLAGGGLIFTVLNPCDDGSKIWERCSSDGEQFGSRVHARGRSPSSL